jgi:hypothetical protein
MDPLLFMNLNALFIEMIVIQYCVNDGLFQSGL